MVMTFEEQQKIMKTYFSYFLENEWKEKKIQYHIHFLFFYVKKASKANSTTPQSFLIKLFIKDGISSS
jgi:hypothetical protein